MKEEQASESYSSHRPLWTIMVYIAGDNNLSANSIAIMQDLEEASRSSDVRVIAGYDSSAPFHKGARYLEIQHKRYQGNYAINWGLHNDMVYPPGHLVVAPDFCNEQPATIKPATEPTAPEALSRFLYWVLRHHRAQRYMLILFGHGVLVAGNTFLADTTPPSFLRLSEFADIINTHFGPRTGNDTQYSKPHLDILACDNCVMNSVEAAYALDESVDYVIGSQDLMLAVGWPFRKIIQAVQRDPRAPTKIVSRRVLKACARRLLDYSLMERSSEQAVCDLTKLRDRTLFKAIRNLADVLTIGLAIDNSTYKPAHPAIVDAVRLARLEAQAYWDETFVDLYDFCELLLRRCRGSFSSQLKGFVDFHEMFLSDKCKAAETEDNGTPRKLDEAKLKSWFVNTPGGSLWHKIHDACLAVLNEFRPDDPKQGVVPYSYYVCPNLQYSHGISIYFPWTLPEDAIRFEQEKGRNGQLTQDYRLVTAFDEYSGYAFPSCGGTDWTGFLKQFFRATLRNVRMSDRLYETPTKDSDLEISYQTYRYDDRPAPPVNLQKSSPDTGEQDDLPRPRIKNYPRRYYLSPKDCYNKCPEPGADQSSYENSEANKKRDCVPYLGWKIRGLLADVIKWPKEGDDGEKEESR